MAACRKGQTPIIDRAVLQGVPEANGGGGIRVQECAVLVRGHTAADLGLFADDHGLQDAGVGEAEAVCYGGVLRGDGSGCVFGGEVVQVVAYFVDGEGFGFCEGA